jgi:hypothetical protein
MPRFDQNSLPEGTEIIAERDMEAVLAEIPLHSITLGLRLSRSAWSAS